MANSSGDEGVFRKAINQGNSAAWEGRWAEAVEHYGRALESRPDNPNAMNSLALAQFQQGQYDSALQLYQKAATLSPDDPLPAEKSAQIQMQRGEVAEAVKYSLRAANLYLQVRDNDKAINNLTRVVRLDPNHLEAHAELARVYEEGGRVKQAVSEQIAVASLYQHAGKMREARAAIEHALRLDPKNREAQNASQLLEDLKPLPKPIRQGEPTGPLRLPEDMAEAAAKKSAKKAAMAFEAGPDPFEEAEQKALQVLANMLFDISAGEGEGAGQEGGLRAIARVVADGLFARGYSEKRIAAHLSSAIELQSKGESQDAAEEIRQAIRSGLDHPAAHYFLGSLLAQEGDRRETAQRSFQKAVKHTDYALAARLHMGQYLRDQGRVPEATAEYLQALRLADTAVVPEDQAEGLKETYETLIEANAQKTDEKELNRLCKNIHQLLVKENWRSGVSEARGQLPRVGDGAAAPLADILTQANSGRLVEAMARINLFARDGFLRAAMEETYEALEFAPHYLPLHINMGELMLMRDHPQQAIDKFATVARLYSARGESDRATQLYQRIVDISPLDTEARAHLIDQVTASGDTEKAIEKYLEMADVFYRLAQLGRARETFEKALGLAESTDVSTDWAVRILYQMADIDLQRLDWRKAASALEQVRTLAPGDGAARSQLIQLNLRLGQERKAGAELDNYLSFLNGEGRDKEALEFLGELVEENAGFVRGHRRLAEAYQQQGKRAEAIAAWNRVGELLVEAGDREGAKVAVRAILALNPKNADRYEKFLQRLES